MILLLPSFKGMILIINNNRKIIKKIRENLKLLEIWMNLVNG
jgi:hypothetical protein